MPSSRRPLTFEATRKQLFPDRQFIGPRLPIDDYRLAAGILFERYNDHTRRRLHVPQDAHPCIVVSFVYDFTPTRIVQVPVTPEAAVQLQNTGVVVKSKDYLDHWHLSQVGKRCIVEEWFERPLLTDFLAAGASFNIETGQMSWTQYVL